MTAMNRFDSSWFLIFLGLAIFILSRLIPSCTDKKINNTIVSSTYDSQTNEWHAPDSNYLSSSDDSNLIRYGKELIINTAKYFGPRGMIARTSNGMNCQNCHTAAGTIPFGNNFSAVTSTYPKYRDRSGKLETIEYRINECFERSMNGKAIDSNSREMKAMIHYFKWLGKDVPKNARPIGSGTEELPFLNRAADTVKGRLVYIKNCQVCHGKNGQGILLIDSTGFAFPPLWGHDSYNTSAGMYRLTKLAGFIKNNMPFGTTQKKPRLTNEESWDVAAFISSQPRPIKKFSYDWPKISTKPVDYPFGPYTDEFSETQHKYGPFQPIRNKKTKEQLLK
jgi:thiosulfate dehydrogenase